MPNDFLVNRFKTMYTDKQKRIAEEQAALQQKQQQRDAVKQEAALEKENLMRQQEEGERQRQADIARYSENKQVAAQQKQQAIQQKQQVKQQKQQAKQQAEQQKQQEVEKDVMLYNSFPVFKMVGISEKDINPLQSKNFIGASRNLGNNVEKALKLLKEGYRGDANHEPISPSEEEYKRLMMMAYENPRGPISKFVIYHDNNSRRNIAKEQAKSQKEFNKNIMKKDSGFNQLGDKLTNEQKLSSLIDRMDSEYKRANYDACQNILNEIVRLAQVNETCKVLIAKSLKDKYKGAPPDWLDPSEGEEIMQEIDALLSSDYAAIMDEAKRTGSETLQDNKYNWIDRTNGQPVTINTDF